MCKGVHSGGPLMGEVLDGKSLDSDQFAYVRRERLETSRI